VEQRRLGPVVGLGTWHTFDGDAALAREVVSAAVDAGCRIVDTSPMYGGAEASLAAALEGRPDDVDVATKIWADSVEDGRRQFAAQLGWYGRVEIEQVHNLVAWESQLPWLPLAAELGLAVIVMRPLGSRSRRLLGREPAARELEPLRDFGVETWAQALLKWALSDERVDLVIPATRRPERARENAAAGESPWLGPDERRLVERLAA
jgi:diketogulonate reductase-like aldo/keto reductase